MNASNKISKAIAFANTAHAGHFRKGTSIPYIFHVLNVGKLLTEEMECEEDVVVAGILHDTVEDTPVTYEDIEREFGQNVLRLVKGASEQDKSDTWENRKAATIEHTADEAIDVLQVKLADKYDNITAIQRDAERMGDLIWKRFNAPKDRLHWYYKSLGEIFVNRFERSQDKNFAAKYLGVVEAVFR